ncbi:MAG: hypothetical protein RLZZ502_903 [Pseudomonadota bacterium]
MNKLKRISTGFTLIELLIVVGIVMVLASFAYNLYTPEVDAARRADAIAGAYEVANICERHYTENNTFVGCEAKFGSAARSPKTALTDADAYWTIAGATTANTYLITLTPNTGASKTAERQTVSACGIMTINQAGVRTVTTSTVQQCFKR